MEDAELVGLFWARDENAIAAVQRQYGRYCYAIAYNILQDAADAEEVVNDVYLNAWNSMPPHRPEALAGFLGKLTRYAALKKRRDAARQKRGGGEPELVYEELADCLASAQTPQTALEAQELTAFLQRFLAALPETERRVFLRRYWYFDSIAAIAGRLGFRESRVKSMLFRTRAKLRRELQKEELL